VSLDDDQGRQRVSKWASVKDGWASTWWVERWSGPRVALIAAVAVAVAILLLGLIYTVQYVLGWPSPANL
jgi:hypothetical protein